jgi:hypothetical protein
MIAKQEIKISEMNKSIESLKMHIAALDIELVKTTTYVKTLLSYLETVMPEGANGFVAEMAKEIRHKSQ